MKYMMRQKMICFGNDFTIADESGRDVFYVDGRAFAFGQQLSFQNMQGSELAFISQKLLRFRKTFHVLQNRRRIAEVTKSLFSFRDRFFIDVPGPDDITVTGRLIEHEYSFTRNGKEIARTSKKWFRMSDSYGIDIVDEISTVLVLSCAVIIDLCCHQKGSK